MSNAYKFNDSEGTYFVTLTVVGWVDIFSRQVYRDFIIENLKFCQLNKGLLVHAWVMMTNHIHLIVSADKSPTLSEIIRDFKKFTSKGIRKLINEENESRREWMLRHFTFTGIGNSNNNDFQFWVQDSHPIQLLTADFTKQKLDYLHNNPVRAGLVAEPQHWLYSSAIDYMDGKGLLPVGLI